MMKRMSEGEMVLGKKARTSKTVDTQIEPFESLPDDVVSVILAKLCSTASCPADFISCRLTCTRMNRLVVQPAVLKEAGINTVAVRAKNWSDSAKRFLLLCAHAGSNEASYFLGMIQFYCMEARVDGAAMIRKAAIENHAPSLYSLAIIHFNGSGGSRDGRNIRTACALCALAAELGSVDALRELGYCFQDGYGVRQSLTDGRNLLIQATAVEIACCIRASPQRFESESELESIMSFKVVPGANPGLGRGIWNGIRLYMSPRETHPANGFLLEWFEQRRNEPGLVGLSLCSNADCGRPETRVNEFRRCAGCSRVKYCSRGCQSQDWKTRHQGYCFRMPRLFLHNAVEVDQDH